MYVAVCYRVISYFRMRFRACQLLHANITIKQTSHLSLPRFPSAGVSSDLIGGFADFSSPAATAILPSGNGMYA